MPDSEIIIVRAKEGSKELIPPLQAAGLEVKDIATYETLYEMDDILSEIIKASFYKGDDKCARPFCNIHNQETGIA